MQHRLLFDQSGQTVPLPPKAFDTLLVLVEHAGALVDKRALLETIWPRVVVEENNLNQCISVLRRALGERPGEHRFIVTEPGRGYRFVAPVARWAPGDDQEPEPAVRPVERAASPVRRPWRRAYVAAALALAIALVATPLLRRSVDRAPQPAAVATPAAAPAPRAVLPRSIAVLPFDDLSADRSKPHIAERLHSDLIRELAKLDLAVIASERVRSYATAAASYEAVASELGVEWLLVGNVRYSDEDVVVSVSLLDPTTGVVVSSHGPRRAPLDERSADAFAASVASEVNAHLHAAALNRMALRPTVPAEALRAYVAATAAREAGKRSEALALFEEAIDLEPLYAAAHAQHALLAARSLIDWGYDRAVAVDPGELAVRVTTSAQRALQLDPTLAIAHVAIAEMNMVSWRWSDAEAAFAAAHAANRNEPEVLLYYSQFKASRGEHRAAVQLAQRYFDAAPPVPDPVDRGSGSYYALWLANLYHGDIDAAIPYLRDHLAVRPRQVAARLNLGLAEARRGQRAAAAQAFATVEAETVGARSPTLAANLAYGYSRLDRRVDAARLVEEVEAAAAERPLGDGTRAMAELAMGRQDEALRYLDRVLEKIARHEPDTGWFSLMILKHNVTGDPVLETAPFARRRARLRGN